MRTDADETGADLHRLFSGLIRLASRMRLRNAMHPSVRNLAQTDVWLLSHLAATGPARMSALAEWQAVDPSTMTAQVKHLERAGLARRHTDPTDRRASIVTLTKEGETVCDEIRRGASAFFADLLSGWTPEQRRELIESMTRLSAALEEHL